jgi:hypothetical protein
MRTGALIETLPVPSRWDFGGHPYGLEPLTLPDTVRSAVDGDEDRGMPSADDLESSRHSLRALGEAQDPALSPIPDLVERLFWFRWITGHQTTFILWQLLAQAMRRGTGDTAVDQESCRVFVRGYSAMLLYTGSCPRDAYHSVIRPSMALQHPGFSGSWGRDFWPVRGLLRPGGAQRTDTPLGRECALNVLIHEGIADKLVPGGQSLLKSVARQEDMTWKRSSLAVLYDMYFLTLRAAVPYEVVVRQLMRRLHAIARDIATNGLYPADASSAEERPPSLRSDRAEECERTIPETLFAIATQVASRLQIWEGQ